MAPLVAPKAEDTSAAEAGEKSHMASHDNEVAGTRI
jgi:hypothetical protein